MHGEGQHPHLQIRLLAGVLGSGELFGSAQRLPFFDVRSERAQRGTGEAGKLLGPILDLRSGISALRW